MNILFISTACSKKMLEKVFNINPSMYGIQGQNFIGLIIKGLTDHKNITLEVLTKYSNRKLLHDKIHYGSIKEIEDNIKYIYLPESSLLKNLLPFFSNIFHIFKWSKNNKNGVIICDGLCLTLLFSTIIATKLTRTHTCTFTTDLPRFLLLSDKLINRIIKKSFAFIWEKTISLSDSFIVLTYPMNNALNPKNKPFVVIEGLVDSNKKNNFDILLKENTNVCLYAGTLNKIYGIDKLVNAFLKMKLTNYELHIYGGGDYEDNLRIICNEKSNVKFFGWQPNDKIVDFLPKASLLINPRPSEEDYTKYSFPSKTMEYMLSGTPLLTTKLTCIPNEYFDHLYFFEDESIEGMSKTMELILSIPLQDRLNKGYNARNFVLNKKNNKVQAEKIFSMLENSSHI